MWLELSKLQSREMGGWTVKVQGGSPTTWSTDGDAKAKSKSGRHSMEAWSKVENTRWQDIRPRSGLEVAPPKEGALKIYLVNFRSLTHLPVEGFGFEP